MAHGNGESGAPAGGQSRAAVAWAALSAVAAIAAAVIAWFSYTGIEETNSLAQRANDIAAAANSRADEANQIGSRGLELAEQNEGRLNQQTADGVLLGEAPSKMKGRFPLPDGVKVWFVVYNTTNKPIENVWVADAQQRSIKIQGIQPCTMYALEAGFKPTDLYFSDRNGRYWHRAYNGPPEALSPDEFPAMPDEDTGGDSPWDLPIENCSTD